MMYGSEAIIPLETTIRIDQFDDKGSKQLLSASLNSIEEMREISTVKLAHY